jgi:Uma2 family endonuclease
MAECGALAPDARVELLDGKIIDMLPIGPFHGGTVTRLNRLFEQENRGRWLTSIQNSLKLSAHYEPQPDLALLKPRDDFYTKQIPGPDDVFLVIEISDATLLLDREVKLPAYARAAIPEMWLVNVPQKKVEVYRAPRNGVYAQRLEMAPGSDLSPEAFPDVKIDLKALFGV